MEPLTSPVLATTASLRSDPPGNISAYIFSEYCFYQIYVSRGIGTGPAERLEKYGSDHFAYTATVEY